MDYVKKIALADQKERRNALLDILRDEGIPFAHYHQLHDGRYDDDWVENIVVSINPSDKRLVIGAHYDTYEGSSGANDNASGVSILIRLAKVLLEKRNLSVDLVFFDFEECGKSGSEKYIESVGRQNISAMINLDVCGHGNCIVVYPKGNETNSHFGNMLSPSMLQKHKVMLLDYMPKGDDESFDNVNIPSIAICVYPASDAIAMQKLYEDYVQTGAPLDISEIFTKMEETLAVMSTMHNGANDNIHSVSQAAMDMVFAYLCETLT